MGFYGDKDAGFHMMTSRDNVDAGETIKVDVDRYFGMSGETKRYETKASKLYVIKKSNFTEEDPRKCIVDRVIEKNSDGKFMFDTTGLAAGKYYIAVPGQKGEKSDGGLDESIVEGLMHMLDTHNSYVKTFRSAREILEANKHAEIAIRLVAPGESDGP